MYSDFGDDVEFLLVYIREAHPSDGWQSRANVTQGIVVEQPKTLGARKKAYQQMCQRLDLSIPAVIDTMDDKVNQAYNGSPDRLYLIGIDGRIAYQGAPGPRGFRPAELETAIQQALKTTRPSDAPR